MDQSDKKSCLGLWEDSIFFQETTYSLENIKITDFDCLRMFCSGINRYDKMVTKKSRWSFDAKHIQIQHSAENMSYKTSLPDFHMLWFRPPAHAKQLWHFAFQDPDHCAARQTNHKAIKSLTSHSCSCSGVFGYSTETCWGLDGISLLVFQPCVINWPYISSPCFSHFYLLCGEDISLRSFIPLSKVKQGLVVTQMQQF